MQLLVHVVALVEQPMGPEHTPVVRREDDHRVLGDAVLLERV